MNEHAREQASFTLKDYLDVRVMGIDRELASLRDLFQQARASDKEASSRAETVARDAINKAEEAMGQRFSLLNELRGVVNDQSQEFAKSESVDVRFREHERRFEDGRIRAELLNNRLSAIEGRFLGLSVMAVILSMASIGYSFVR